MSSHATPVSEVWTSRWIVGSAGTTAEASTAYASPAMQRTTSVRVGLDRDRAPGAAAGGT